MGVGGTAQVPLLPHWSPVAQLALVLQGSPGPARQHGPLGHTAVLALHSPLAQSALLWHPWPPAQGGQAGPPQSTPVSSQSCVPLVQVEIATLKGPESPGPE